MPRLDSRSRAILIGLAIVALAVGYYLLAYEPAVRRLGGLQQELQQEEDRLARDRAVVEEIPQLEAAVAEIQALAAELEAQIPVAPRVAELLQYLDRAQRQAGVRVMELDFAPGEPVEQYVRYPIHFRVEGPFPGQARFLELVEELERLVLVGGLRVEALEEPPPGRVVAHYVVYLFVDERTAPTVEDLEDLVFARRPGRVNPFLPPSP
ncbi:MAG TPA: type 4a pilus biogenesis protein PilO [Bacillota bacterium]|nr:type 4a pilus biogenesis protein PilO [Bacillota bacterium]